MTKRLINKVALVTGGSRGIGRAICERLAAEGAHVYVNYNSGAGPAEETVGLCKAAGGTAEAMGFNISESDSVDEAFKTIKEKSGQIDILVNNAGISKDGLFVRLKNDDWDKTLGTNLNGAFYCSRAAAKLMMKARTGRIINISSVVGEMGNAGQAPYCASKAGLIGLTKSLARELAPRNVTVNAVAPGFIETDMTDALSDNVKEDMLNGIPLGRYGQAGEVASLVAFLGSESAAYITGQTISINGGLYM